MIGRLARMLNPVKALRAGWGVLSDARRAGREYGMGTLALAREQVSLQLATGMPRDGFYRLGLYDATLTREDKMTFVVGERLRPLWHRFTPPHYHHLFKNKFLFKQLFGSLGYPVSPLYGTFDPQWGQTVAGAPLRTAADVADLLTAHPDVEFAVKPVESAEGNMILVFGERRDGDPRALVSLDGQEYGPEDLVRHMTDRALLRDAYPGMRTPISTFLFEQRVHPHPGVQALSGQTLCCVRVVTFVGLDGKSEILGAGFKLQVRPSSVDNLAAGGMAVHVDLESGKLGEGVLIGADYIRRHREHPESGLKFYGYQLPLWPELKDLALRAALAFPNARAVGWDIAISPDGPVLIEGNPAFGGQLPQTFARRGLLSPAVREFLQRSGGA